MAGRGAAPANLAPSNLSSVASGGGGTPLSAVAGQGPTAADLAIQQAVPWSTNPVQYEGALPYQNQYGWTMPDAANIGESQSTYDPSSGVFGYGFGPPGPNAAGVTPGTFGAYDPLYTGAGPGISSPFGDIGFGPGLGAPMGTESDTGVPGTTFTGLPGVTFTGLPTTPPSIPGLSPPAPAPAAPAGPPGMSPAPAIGFTGETGFGGRGFGPGRGEGFSAPGIGIGSPVPGPSTRGGLEAGHIGPLGAEAETGFAPSFEGVIGPPGLGVSPTGTQGGPGSFGYGATPFEGYGVSALAPSLAALAAAVSAALGGSSGAGGGDAGSAATGATGAAGAGAGTGDGTGAGPAGTAATGATGAASGAASGAAAGASADAANAAAAADAAAATAAANAAAYAADPSLSGDPTSGYGQGDEGGGSSAATS